MRRALDLHFKGARSYVQGADMVNAAMRELAHAGEVANLVFVMNRMTGRNLDLVLDEEHSPGGLPVASVRFEVQGARRQALLVERAEPPHGRHPYDEEALRERCRLELASRNIVLERPSPFTPAETMVTMTKALHLAVFPDPAAKWIFARLEAPRWPPASFGEGVSVGLAHALGTRLTKSRVSLGEATLAWIFFALKEGQ